MLTVTDSGFTLPEGTLNHDTLREDEAHNSRRQFSHTDLKNMLDEGSARMEEHKTKITMGNHELVVEEGVAKAANFALWVKDLVGTAVEASPQASFTWAGVCLVLPLLTNPQTAKEAQRDGFDYATETMHYYTALEPIIRRYDKNPEENVALAKVEVSLEKLYQLVLEFQIKSVLRFYKGSLGRYWQDLIASTDWKKMKERIRELAKTVDNEIGVIHDLVTSSELKSLNRTSEESSQRLQKLLLISQQQLDTTQVSVALQKDAAARALSKEQDDVRHLFLLSSGSQNATYEWYKSRVEDSIQGTCQWFLGQEGYTQWLAQESGILLVTADPGCGKSVLSKHLIDHELQPTTIYFFFKDQDQNTVRQALCALLHQLFIKNPSLIKYAMAEHSNSGNKMIHGTISLWRIFNNVVRDSRLESVIIVLDALDECAEPELRDLTKGLIQHFQTQSPHGPQSGCKLKVLLTSRPYKTIANQLRKLLSSFPSVRIPGEQYSEAIGKEVNLVIEKRVEQLQLSEELQEAKRLELKQLLRDKLCAIQNRTYLWVHLVFEQLENEGLDMETEQGVDSFFAMPPTDLAETYTRILQKCTDPKKTRMAFAIMLAADRPLSISEFNVAMNVRSDQQGFQDLDLEPNEVFASKLPSLCGLLISIHHEKVYFLHQTAREFLLESSSTGPEYLFENYSSTKARPDENWHNSISLRYAHTVMAEQCVFFLKLWNTGEPRHPEARFHWYAFIHWPRHIKEANFNQNASVIPAIIEICQPESSSFQFWRIAHDSHPETRFVVCVASYHGLRAVVEKLWTTGKAEIDSKDDKGRTPLFYAARCGEVAMVQWLLETDKVDVNSQDRFGNTPLKAAAERGHSAVFKLLLDTGKIDVNSADHNGYTQLHWAAIREDEAIVKLLLGTKQVDINIKNERGLTALDLAEQSSYNHDIAGLLRNCIA